MAILILSAHIATVDTSNCFPLCLKYTSVQGPNQRNPGFQLKPLPQLNPCEILYSKMQSLLNRIEILGDKQLSFVFFHK